MRPGATRVPVSCESTPMAAPSMPRLLVCLSCPRAVPWSLSRFAAAWPETGGLLCRCRLRMRPWRVECWPTTEAGQAHPSSTKGRRRMTTSGSFPAQHAFAWLRARGGSPCRLHRRRAGTHAGTRKPHPPRPPSSPPTLPRRRSSHLRPARVRYSDARGGRQPGNGNGRGSTARLPKKRRGETHAAKTSHTRERHRHAVGEKRGKGEKNF